MVLFYFEGSQAKRLLNQRASATIHLFNLEKQSQLVLSTRFY